MDQRRELLNSLFSRRGIHKKNQRNPGYREFVSRFFAESPPQQSIVVAGTNGKGSTCFWLSQLLRLKGLKVGLFTSPHLRHVEERIQINHSPISQGDFAQLLTEFEQGRWGTGTRGFSFFEVLTFLAHRYFFEEHKVDVAIFEVGVGGMNDPVNLIPHSHSLVTNVSMDHVDLLGPNWEDIVQHKVGIFENSKINYVIDQRLQNYLSSSGQRFERFNLNSFSRDQLQLFNNWPSFKMSNFFGAVAIADRYLGRPFSLDELSSVGNLQWPGRFQPITLKGRSVILSGDHNEEGVLSLVESINRRSLHTGKGLFKILLGINPLKNTERFEHILQPFAPVQLLPQTVFSGRQITETASEEIMRLQSLKNYIEIELAEMPLEKELIITGSLYLVGQVAEAFDLDLFKPAALNR